MKTEVLSVRLEPEELSQLQAAAEAEKRPLSQWARLELLDAAKRRSKR